MSCSKLRMHVHEPTRVRIECFWSSPTLEWFSMAGFYLKYSTVFGRESKTISYTPIINGKTLCQYLHPQLPSNYQVLSFILLGYLLLWQAKLGFSLCTQGRMYVANERTMLYVSLMISRQIVLNRGQTVCFDEK